MKPAVQNIMFVIALGLAGSASYLLPASQSFGLRSSLFAVLMFTYMAVFHRRNANIVLHDQDAHVATKSTKLAPTPALRNGDPMPVLKNSTQKAGKSTAANEPALNWFQVEAAIINNLLKNRFMIDARIHLRNPTAIIQAYNFINYRVDELNTIEFLELRKISNDLARAINASPHRSHQYGTVQVLVHDTQPIVLQVSHPRPTRLNWADRPKNAELTAALGVYYSGAKRTVMQIDLKGDRANGAIMGAPGGGKSIALRGLLIQLIESTPPNLLQVWGIDLKVDVFQEFAGLPHLADYTGDKMEALDILKQFAYWASAAGAKRDGVYRLLLIDEFQDLTTDPEIGEEALNLIDGIMRRGREFGIRVLVACQLPDNKSYPTILKSKTHWMASAFILHDNYLTKQLDIYGASKLPEKGEMVFHGPGLDCTVTAYWLPKENIPAEIAKLHTRWGTVTQVPAPVTADDGEPEAIKVAFPIMHRPLTPTEQAAVRILAEREDHKYLGKPSLNKLCFTVYGSKNDDKMDWIKEAFTGE